MDHLFLEGMIREKEAELIRTASPVRLPEAAIPRHSFLTARILETLGDALIRLGSHIKSRSGIQPELHGPARLI